MSFEDTDKAIQGRIVAALVERQTINMNKEIGVAHFQAEHEDKINPSVTITRDELRAMTGREKVRDVVLKEYENALKRPGIDVERLDPNTLKVSLTPVRTRENEFNSLAALSGKNEKELEVRPDLGEPPY